MSFSVRLTLRVLPMSPTARHRRSRPTSRRNTQPSLWYGSPDHPPGSGRPGNLQAQGGRPALTVYGTRAMCASALSSIAHVIGSPPHDLLTHQHQHCDHLASLTLSSAITRRLPATSLHVLEPPVYRIVANAHSQHFARDRRLRRARKRAGAPTYDAPALWGRVSVPDFRCPTAVSAL